MDKLDPRLGDKHTDELGATWVYAGKAGWRRVVEAERQWKDGRHPPRGTKLYAAPVSAKREWVDLTDDEIAEFKDKALYREMSLSEFANAVIAAFKEKNQ